MAKTRNSKKKLSTKKKLAIGLGSAAALGGLGYGGYKLRVARNAKKARRSAALKEKIDRNNRRVELTALYNKTRQGFPPGSAGRMMPLFEK